ncbi:hypothetical protein [Pseudodesulfovibrio piezophilus]|uniref:hypothetical protein n=1 Tax=Pseudodesulfovibrio piezophilus TaxID=879567 RepID=UPI0005A00EAB|nr:hypothetical protein [Pseudodesulfovibrio piezophilus]
MNFINIFQLPNEFSQTTSAISNGFSAGLICSATVNMALLTIILLGAVWLVAPYELRGHRPSRKDDPNNS